MNNTMDNKRKAALEQRRIEIENAIQQFQRLILEQDHKIEDLESAREKELDSIFKDLLSVIDAFDKADARLAERYPGNKEVISARTRFATAKISLRQFLITMEWPKLNSQTALQHLKTVKSKIQNQTHQNRMTQLYL